MLILSRGKAVGAVVLTSLLLLLLCSVFLSEEEWDLSGIAVDGPSGTAAPAIVFEPALPWSVRVLTTPAEWLEAAAARNVTWETRRGTWAVVQETAARAAQTLTSETLGRRRLEVRPPHGTLPAELRELLARYGVADEQERPLQRYLCAHQGESFVDLLVHTRPDHDHEEQLGGLEALTLRLFDVALIHSRIANPAAGGLPDPPDVARLVPPEHRSMSVFARADLLCVEEDGSNGATLFKYTRRALTALPRTHAHWLVVGGDDRHLDNMEECLRVVCSRYMRCGRVFFEAFDGDPMLGPGLRVRPMPIGFTPRYTAMAAPGPQRALAELCEAPLTDDPQRSRNGLFTAWGKHSRWLDSGLRRHFVLWTNAQRSWLQRQDVPKDQFLAALRQHRFLLSPIGNGVQSPKYMEAILMGCVPVVKRQQVFEELAAAGYPSVLLPAWNALNGSEALDPYYPALQRRLRVARIMLIAEVWFAYLTQPLDRPMITNIEDFLRTQSDLR